MRDTAFPAKLRHEATSLPWRAGPGAGAAAGELLDEAPWQGDLHLPVAARRHLQILGIRGIPGQHGGFETFAEYLAPYLVGRGWDVTVYCQSIDAEAGGITEDVWRGVRRITIPVRSDDAYGSLVFDRKSIQLASRRPGLCLVLGYNTAILTLLLRARGKTFVTNMDGIEWKRAKWSLPFKAWFYLNDWIGSLVSHHLIADHPRISEHLSRRTRPRHITMIPYGAEPIEAADPAPLARLGVAPGQYLLAICRPEPENLMLELVRAFSSARRGRKFVVLGHYAEDNPYHRAVRQAASDEVIFPGAIYEKAVVRALRLHARAYVHGHTVGGTNPSLVEALGAGNAVIAHDNPFNRWVAGEGQFYFADEGTCAERMALALKDEGRLAFARVRARARFEAHFTWENILGQYEALLARLEAREAAPSRGAIFGETHAPTGR